MRSSSAGAEMLADKEKAAENTLCILKGFDAVSARQNRVCPCQPTQGKRKGVNEREKWGQDKRRDVV